MDREYGAHYGELYRRHWWWRAREAAILDVIQWLRTGRGAGRFLDVGCGDALFFDQLSQFGTVEGVEPESALVSEESRSRFRIHLGGFDDSYHPQGQFDVVLFLDVLEHLDDPAGALRRAADLLVPGGVIVVTVPAYRWLWTHHDDLNHHRTRYSPDTLRTLALSANCGVVRLQHLFQALVVAKLGVRLLERIVKSDPRPPGIPRPPINRFLLGICRFELALQRIIRVPIGSSLLAVLVPNHGGAIETGVRSEHQANPMDRVE